MEPYRWSVRASSGPGDRTIAYVRKSRIEIGAPLSFDAAYPAATALECLLAALAGDMIGGFRDLCGKRRIRTERIEAVVSATLDNPLVHLGVVGETGAPGIEMIAVRVFVDSPADESAVREAWGEALRRSPIANTLGPLLRLEAEIVRT